MNYQSVGDNSLSALGSAILFAILPQSYRGYTFSFVGDELCYYLGSRFYSPRLGRFLNADKHFDTGTGILGTNMFTYCNNNPVMYVDPNGEASKSYTDLINALLALLWLETFASYLNTDFNKYFENSSITFSKYKIKEFNIRKRASSNLSFIAEWGTDALMTAALAPLGIAYSYITHVVGDQTGCNPFGVPEGQYYYGRFQFTVKNNKTKKSSGFVITGIIYTGDLNKGYSYIEGYKYNRIF